MNFKNIFWLKSETLSHFFVTSFGTITNGFLGVLFYLVVAVHLGPIQFGLFVFAITTMSLLADICNLGSDTGLIRFINKYRNERDIQLKFLKFTFELKLIVWIVLVSISWFVIPLIATSIFNKKELIFPIRLSVIGVGGSLLFSFVTNSLQAYQKFKQWSYINIGSNFVRLVLVLIISYWSLSTTSSLMIFIGVLFASFLVGINLLPSFYSVRHESSVKKEFFHYNKWVAIFVLLAAVSSRLDTYLTARMLTVSDMGIYGFANQLVSVFPQLTYALAIVVAPKFASFKDDFSARQYFNKIQLLTISFSLLLLFISILLAYGLFIFFDQYRSSVTPLLILVISNLIFLLALPYHQAIFYYFSYPKLFIWTSLGNILILLSVGPLFISRWGIIGTALAVLTGSIFNFIVPSLWVTKKFNKR